MKDIISSKKMKGLPKNLRRQTIRSLQSVGLTQIEMFATISERELLKLNFVGPKSIQIIGELLKIRGLKFANTNESIRIKDLVKQFPSSTK